MADNPLLRRFRFRLRTLFVLTTIVACLTMVAKGLYQRLFRDDETQEPRPTVREGGRVIRSGGEPEYWWDHSAIVARVSNWVDGGTGTLDGRIRLQPLGTLSGTPDYGADAELVLRAGTVDVLGYSLRDGREPGAVVIAVITDHTQDMERARLSGPDWTPYIDPGTATYMPESKQLIKLCGVGDAVIDEVLTSIRKARQKSSGEPTLPPYRRLNQGQGCWATHSVVYASIAARVSTPDGTTAAIVDLLPTLRLSGEFDPGLFEKVSVRVDLKELSARQEAIPASGNALVLLIRDGNSYAVAPERADFMPGDHFPICSVKDFADPKIAETLKKIQEARAKEKKPEKAGDSGLGAGGSGAAPEKADAKAEKPK
jgi:hypothetical protein